MKKKIGVLISGRGTNLQAIIDATSKADFPGEVVVVISNKKRAYGLERANRNKIPNFFIGHKSFTTREKHEIAIIEILKKYQVDLIVLAGYMRILSPLIIREFKNRIINIHPALLPSFPGTKAHKEALEYGVKVSGCTAHFIDEGVDTGPIITQSVIQILDNDTVESLSERLLPLEHEALIKSIELWCNDKLIVEGRIVKIKA
ncbi:MAG: phosphoribosylglycinamide formyltransferase [Candidatus Ranarchaeia archaeon]